MPTVLLTNFWLPRNISAHGEPIDQLINVTHWFMAVLFVGWGAYFVYCLVRFRAREGHTANYKLIKAKPTKYAEILVVVIEAVLLIWFSTPVLAAWKKAPGPDKGDPFTVRVVAQQFAWNIHYPGPDGKFGPTRPELVNEATNPIGLDENHPDASDDYVSINNFHFPVNKPILVRLTTKDVIHSFSIPEMRVKQDAIPGMEIPVWFEARQEAQVDIACAQLCGLGHYRMRGQAYIETQEAFDAWFAEQGEEEFFDEDEFD